MLGMCYPRRASLQQKGQPKPLKQSFHGNYKDLADLDRFPRCFTMPDWNFCEYEGEWKRVLADGWEVPGFGRPWEHVLRSTGGNGSDTSQLYKEEVVTVEKQARAVFVEEDIINKCSRDEFLQVITEQGCFILQVALCYLGGGPKTLGYPPDDPLFGEKGWNNRLIKFLVNRYIFSIENQVPLVVLKVLMKQSFFQNVLRKGKWKRLNDLASMALYDFLVQPMLLDLHDPALKNPRGNFRRRRSPVGFFHKNSHWPREHQPNTLLHALWLLLTGPPPGSSGSSPHCTSNHVDDEEKECHDHLYNTTLSAKELQEAGISFKSFKGLGTRRIKFKKRMLEAHLYLPCIYVESHTVGLLKNLIDFERDVDLEINQREVSAYINLMSDLIRSRDDVRVLVKGDIIDIDPKYEIYFPEGLAYMGRHFDRLEMINSHNFAAIRRQTRRYVKPSMRTKIMNLVVIGVLLTLVQTIYTVLSYHHPLH
ncbi:uncharacterized protein LOC122064286 [Macadamia integrifolia]|uniref:uncharacterized protein LOC122064286 n=1 Tax=Macadamia integrifolia TaxID=60698 RepID=UPI001C4E5A42|nr:uncharacterized protein LOC122064286 [Macadamia integrifolia]